MTTIDRVQRSLITLAMLALLAVCVAAPTLAIDAFVVSTPDRGVTVDRLGAATYARPLTVPARVVRVR